MEKITLHTLYTDRYGMMLYMNQIPFIASAIQLEDDDYLVIATSDCIEECKGKEAEKEQCYLVSNYTLSDVTVELIKKENE